jgi:carboxyl-terminal processing protease
MTSRKPVAALVLVLTLVSCSPGEDAAPEPTSTTAPAASTTVAPTTTSSPPQTTVPDTTFPVTDRELELADCEDPPEDTAIVCEAYDLIKERYVDDIDDAALAESAAAGLALLDGADAEGLLVCAAPAVAFTSTCDLAAVAADDTNEAAEAMVAGFAAFALDPNSAYFDPDALDLLQEEQEGEIQGIGALVSPEDQTLPGDNKQCGVISETCEMIIVSTIEGAPAADVGLMGDDEIVAVNGDSIVGWTVDEVTAMVRGQSGTDVTLTIERAGERFEVTITRAAVQIPVIEDEVIGEVGYLRLWNFTGSASTQFETAIVDLLGQGVDELVIDLRNNPGGFLTTAIDVASVFVDEGDVVVTEGPNDDNTYPVNGTAIVPDDMEVTFVVNKGSASASEVVAATLQERGRATVVGENTFGKNTVQQRFSLSNGGALKLTIARWLTPGGLDFGGGGVTPDVEIENVSTMTTAEVVAAATGP